MVMIPVTTHAARNSAGESVVRPISASTRKIPDPIIEPTTMAVELKRPSDCTNCGLDGMNAGAGVSRGWEIVGIVTGIGFTGIGLKSLLLSFTPIQAPQSSGGTPQPGPAAQR